MASELWIDLKTRWDALCSMLGDGTIVTNYYSSRGTAGTETVGILVHWVQSRFGEDVCAELNDIHRLLVEGGWHISVDERTIAHPALFNAITAATHGLPRWAPDPIQTREQATRLIDSRIRQQR